MQLAEEYIGNGHPVTKVLKYLGIASSSFYYTPKEDTQTRGKKQSKVTRIAGKGYVSNEQVVREIEALLEKEFVDYGYRKVTHWLRQVKKYVINEKKVYRLMKQHGLLNRRDKPKKMSNRLWVNQLIPTPTASFEHLEVDIKYMWIAGKRRYALLMTIIDVRSRWVLGQLMDWRIRKGDVIELFKKVFSQYPFPKSVFVRNDNGSQFEAQMVRLYFEDEKVIQEFTRPATPEQNAHIESYHSILESVICVKYEFEDLEEARQTMNRFVQFYNFERIHSGIGYTWPAKYLSENGIEITNNENTRKTLNCDSLTFTSESMEPLQFIGG